MGTYDALFRQKSPTSDAQKPASTLSDSHLPALNMAEQAAPVAVYPNPVKEQFATTPSRHHDLALSRHPAITPSSHQQMIFDMVKEVLDNKATEKTTLRFTTRLSEALEDFLLQAKKRYKVRLPKNAVITLGLAYLLWEFEEKERESLLYKLISEESAER